MGDLARAQTKLVLAVLLIVSAVALAVHVDAAPATVLLVGFLVVVPALAAIDAVGRGDR